MKHQSPSLEEVRQQALGLGWDDVGVTDAIIPEEDITAYKTWIRAGHHADLLYMENAIRCTPQELLPGAQTAIIFVTNYKQEKQEFRDDAGLIASYARGRDYHNVHRSRLKKFITWLETYCGQKGIAKGFSDSTPILEKALAVKAGLGWFGKNTLLIHRKFGTFTLLAGVLTTIEIPHTEPSLPLRLPRCGTCQRCIDSCPTNALVNPYQLDATRCLSYHLIESKKEIPENIKKQNPGYLFGCDICQNVCPHNVRSPLSDCKDFSPEQGMGAYLNLDQLEKIEQHPETLHGTPLKRKGASGLLTNTFTKT